MLVPERLPPALSWSTELVAALSAADRAVGELAGLGSLSGGGELLRLVVGPLVHREAVLSSRIEGTRADLDDVYARAAGQPDRRDAQEVLNYVRAIEFGVERLATLPVSLRLIRELHERLTSGVRGDQAYPGEFRRGQNWIGPPGATLGQATYVPPPVPEMHEALDAFERFLHAESDLPPLVRLGLIHAQFEAIHPFVDGNGRVGRLLVSLLPVAWGLLPLPLLNVSAFLDARRDEYYARLLGVATESAWPAWLGFFLAAVAESAKDAVGRVRALQDLRVRWRARLEERRASALALRLAEHLFAAPLLTIPQAQAALGVTYRAAALNVAKLVDAGILRPVGEAAYGRTFVAPELISLLGA
ncbi:MAG TPA: Fic family protein [Chloroflexota bacterium]